MKLTFEHSTTCDSRTHLNYKHLSHMFVREIGKSEHFTSIKCTLHDYVLENCTLYCFHYCCLLAITLYQAVACHTTTGIVSVFSVCPAFTKTISLIS